MSEFDFGSILDDPTSGYGNLDGGYGDGLGDGEGGIDPGYGVDPGLGGDTGYDEMPPSINDQLPLPSQDPGNVQMTPIETLTQSPAYLQWAKTVGPAVAQQALQQAARTGLTGVPALDHILSAAGKLVGIPDLGGVGGPGGGSVQGGQGTDFLNPQTAALAAGAYNDWRNADRYTQQAENYATKLDPFGGQRAGYADQLAHLEQHPEDITNDPHYQFVMRQGLASLGAQDASNGRLAFDASTGAPSGGMGKDYIDYASGLASSQLQARETQLSNLAGAQFGPAAAAGMYSQGMQMSAQARNNAMANLTQLATSQWHPGQGGTPPAPVQTRPDGTIVAGGPDGDGVETTPIPDNLPDQSPDEGYGPTGHVNYGVTDEGGNPVLMPGDANNEQYPGYYDPRKVNGKAAMKTRKVSYGSF